MRRVLLSVWKEISLLPRRMMALLAGAPFLARNVLREKIARCRLAIIAASILVCAYTQGGSPTPRQLTNVFAAVARKVAQELA